MSASEIVNTMMSSWDIIRNNEVNGDLIHRVANAVPNVRHWQSLTHTQAAHAIHLRYRWEHQHADHPAEFGLQVFWTYGARYRHGGAYIEAAWTDVPYANLNDPWISNLHVEVHPPSNAGSERAPLALLPISITGEVRAGRAVDTIEWQIELRGNGEEEHYGIEVSRS